MVEFTYCSSVLILHGLLRGGPHSLHENEFKLAGVSERYFMVHAVVIKVREECNKENQGQVPKAPEEARK